MSASVEWVRVVVLLLTRPKRLLAIASSVLVAVLYVWVAAVRAVPAVKARKAALRAKRMKAWQR
jgi:hypothetical protein